VRSLALGLRCGRRAFARIQLGRLTRLAEGRIELELLEGECELVGRDLLALPAEELLAQDVEPGFELVDLALLGVEHRLAELFDPCLGLFGFTKRLGQIAIAPLELGHLGAKGSD
jgi:hypothetical protein